VRLFDVVEEFERGSKFVVHRVRAIADNIETATFLRAAQTERRNNNVAVWFEGSFYMCDIFAAVFGVSEEMKYGTIMPEVVGVLG